MRLDDVQHQPRAISLLRRALRHGRTHHAYLFDGPEGVGKERTALALAARLLCQRAAATASPAGDDASSGGGDFDACGACDACRLMASETHPDYHLVHRGLNKLHPDRSVRATKGLYLTVDLVRHFIITPAGIAPTLGKRRVFVIRDAQRMNDEAQNALLKTLEEPPGQACLILITAAAERLLPTIRSRCQRVPFDALPLEFVAQSLQRLAKLPANAAHTLARLADGRLGVALLWQRAGLLETLQPIQSALLNPPQADPEAFGKALLELAAGLAKRLQSGERDAADDDDSDEAEAPAEASAVERGAARDVPTDQLRDALKLVLIGVAATARDALLLTVDAAPAGGTTVVAPGELEAARLLAERLDADQLDDVLRGVFTCERMLDRNVAPQLALEALALSFAGYEPRLT